MTTLDTREVNQLLELLQSFCYYNFEFIQIKIERTFLSLSLLVDSRIIELPWIWKINGKVSSKMRPRQDIFSGKYVDI